MIRALLVDIAIDSRYNGENCFRPKPSGAWVGHILEPFNFIDSDVTLLGHGGIVFREILKLSSEEIFQILKILIVFV